MFCEICKRKPLDGVSLFRQNKKGEVGIWRCYDCNTKPIDTIVLETVQALEKANEQRTEIQFQAQ